MAQGMKHEIGDCTASSKVRRLVTCKRCNEVNLVWHSCEHTGGIDKGWAMYHQAGGFRRVQADTNRPHVCTGRPKAEGPAPALLEEQAAEVARQAARQVAEQERAALKADVLRAVEATGAALRQAIDTRIDALALPAKSLTIELKREDVTVARIDGAHEQLPELMYWCGATDSNGFRFPVMMFGKPGVGKSHSAHQVAQALGLSFGLISLNPQTPESRLFGFYHANGGYIRTAFREAFENGGVYLIDEIDNASDALLTSLNSCLANGHGAFPDGLIARHPEFVCIATANTPGRGGDANHAGRRQLDAATINRFACIEWRNDDALELRLAESINANGGRVWLDWVRKVRAYCGEHHPRVIVSPRSTMMGAKALLDSPFTVAQVAEMVLFKGLDKDTKAKILAACPLPQAGR